MLSCPNKNDSTSFYRGFGPWGALRKKLPPEIRVEPQREDITWASLKMVDAVFLQRPFNKGHLTIAEMCKSRNIKLWVDYDDALLHVPDDNPTYEQYSNASHQNNVMKILDMADVVTLSTQHLLETYANLLPENLRSEFRRKSHVISNAFDDHDFTYPKNPEDQKRCVMWRGSATHTRDLSDYAIEIVQAHKKAPHWLFTFIGYHPWFIAQHFDKKSYVHSPGIDVYDYFREIALIKPAVCIVPLFDSTFNKCKSNIAWIEASFAGAVTIAPNWDEWKKPGCLTYKTQAEFSSLLESAMREEIDFTKLNKESWEFIEDQLFLSYVNIEREEILRNLLETV